LFNVPEEQDFLIKQRKKTSNGMRKYLQWLHKMKKLLSNLIENKNPVKGLHFV
jgi:hypothetical protein